MAISRADRARQFLPFDALKGLNEALRNKEIEYEDRKELSEEEEEKISSILFSLESGNIIRIGKKETFTETRKVPAHTSYTPHSLYTFHPLTLSVGFQTDNQSRFLPTPEMFVPDR